MPPPIRPATDAEHLAKLRNPVRLSALAATGLMDATADAAFDRLTKLAARWLHAPVALVSLVDGHRQLFKSALGLSEPWASRRETPLSHSFCQYVVASHAPLIVFDAREHPMLCANRAVEELQAIAYAGVPLVTSDDQALGSLCVIDSRPRSWTDEEVAMLQDLAALTMTEVELRLQLAQLRALQVERGKQRILLTSILDSMEDSIVVTGNDGKILLSNPAARQNRPGDVMQTASAIAHYGVFETDGVTPVDIQKLPSTRALAGELVRDLELVVRLPGMLEAFHSVNASPLRDSSGDVFAAVSVGRDVTAARTAQRALARNEAILQAVVKNLPNGAVMLFDHDLRYLMADGEQLLAGVGLTREALIGRTLYDVASPQGLAVVEGAYRSALAGQSRALDLPRGDKTYVLTIVPVKDERGVVTAGLAMVYDVTAHKRGEALAREEAKAVRSLSVRDELTGLYNRRGFMELSAQHLAIAAQTGRPALLFFVDVNGMKQINDQQGHEQGDSALIETADVLRTTFRGADVIARIGGDEFVALLPDGDALQLQSFTERVQHEIDARNHQPNRAYRLSACIGAAAFDPKQPKLIEALMAQADALMYEQKRQRKAAGKTFRPSSC